MLTLEGCFFRSTGPTEVGVKVRKWSLTRKGVDPEIYQPGATFIVLPIIHDWYTFDTKLQNMEFTIKRGRGDRQTRDDLLFKTIDGNDISLDVIISYRIDPKKAPDILQFIARDDTELRENIVRTVARSRPRDIFGELKTEDFYNAEKRAEKAEAAKIELNRILQPFGIIVERVATKDYRFNQAYQKAIEDKKVADQLAEQNKSAAKAAEEENLRKLQDAQGEFNKMIAKVDGDYRKAVIEADAHYEQQQKLAQAIEVEGKAEAQGIQKEREALVKSGGAIMVKLAIADALKDKKIVLLPMGAGGFDLKTTDINQLLQLYGMKTVSGN
jgi:regulator of protease activity HflC (stomatin/prohibitin superfamily)